MIRIVAAPGAFEGVERHLEQPEQVGFFLADFDDPSNTFLLTDWRPMTGADYEIQTEVHVALADEVRGELIQWATSEEKSLVEVHSHGPWEPAQFSASDVYGFSEWVPHLAWRLSGRPYAALVMTAESFDGWAWIAGATEPEQVDELEVEGAVRVATSATFKNARSRHV